MASVFTPLGKNLLLKIIEQKEEKTKAGIFLPENADADTNKPSMGLIEAVGTSQKIAKRGLKVGVKVIYSRYSGTEVNYQEEKYVIVSVDDVLAVVNEK